MNSVQVFWTGGRTSRLVLDCIHYRLLAMATVCFMQLLSVSDTQAGFSTVWLYSLKISLTHIVTGMEGYTCKPLCTSLPLAMQTCCCLLVRVLRSINSRNCALFEESMKLCTIFCLEPLLSEEYHWRRRLTSINRPMTIATHWQNTTVGLLAVAALWWQIRSLPSPYSHVPKQHVGADVCVIMCWLWPITARRRILGYR